MLKQNRALGRSIIKISIPPLATTDILCTTFFAGRATIASVLCSVDGGQLEEFHKKYEKHCKMFSLMKRIVVSVVYAERRILRSNSRVTNNDRSGGRAVVKSSAGASADAKVFKCCVATLIGFDGLTHSRVMYGSFVLIYSLATRRC